MNVQHLLECLRTAAKKEGFEVGALGAIGAYLLPTLHRDSESKDAPHLYLSGGVHGDEPAGPLALLDLLRNRRLSRSIEWSILPVINPTGLAVRSRENANGVDLNRDYSRQPKTTEVRNHVQWLQTKTFTAAVCLHEDYETDGAYLFELKSKWADSHAAELLEAMTPFTGIETRPFIDEMPNENGLMRPPIEALEKERSDLPEAIRLFFENTPWCYTLETPSQKLITERISAHVAALGALSRIALEGGFPHP